MLQGANIMPQGVAMLESGLLEDIEGDAVQVMCIECRGKAVIQSRAEKDLKVSDLYCSCKNPCCGHTFVMTLAFSHTLSHSADSSKRIMIDLLRNLPKAEQLDLIQQMNAH